MTPSAGPALPLSTCCNAPLIGAAVVWCGNCGHTQHASAISHEFQGGAS